MNNILKKEGASSEGPPIIYNRRASRLAGGLAIHQSCQFDR